MIVSRNEIETTARRAGLGVGLPPGLADELGRAAAARPDALPAVVDALDRGPTAPALLPSSDGLTIAAPCSILMVGPSVVDLLVAGLSRITLHGLDVPSLLPAYLDRLATDYGETAAVATDMAGTVTVTLAAATDAPPPPARGEVDVDDATWRRLASHAAKSLVPSDSRSRERGAGAGLTDTD